MKSELFFKIHCFADKFFLVNMTKEHPKNSGDCVILCCVGIVERHHDHDQTLDVSTESASSNCFYDLFVEKCAVHLRIKT